MGVAAGEAGTGCLCKMCRNCEKANNDYEYTGVEDCAMAT